MKLITSAYKAASAHVENAAATSRLIETMVDTGRQFMLAQGVYQGQSEVVVVARDYATTDELFADAKVLCEAFDQDSVYYEIGGVGHLYHRDGRHETLGEEHPYPAHLVHSHMFRQQFKSYTLFPDGSAIAALPYLKVAA